MHVKHEILGRLIYSFFKANRQDTIPFFSVGDSSKMVWAVKSGSIECPDADILSYVHVCSL